MNSRCHVIDLWQFPQHEFVSFFGGFAARAVGYFWICHSIPLFVRRLLTSAVEFGKLHPASDLDISIPQARTSFYQWMTPRDCAGVKGGISPGEMTTILGMKGSNRRRR